MESEFVFPLAIQAQIRDDYPGLSDVVYLDHAGSGLHARSQILAISEELQRTIHGNPHSTDLSRQAIGEIRTLVLDYFKANQYELVFTSGATASLKIVGECFTFSKSGGHFAYLQDNHTSVIGLRQLLGPSNPDLVMECLQRDQLEAGPTLGSSGLLALPALSNFCGAKYPWQAILPQWSASWSSLLDASALVSTCELDLSGGEPDFVVFSFYKIFGYPTGLGGLLVKKSSTGQLSKSYFGGGTVEMHLTQSNQHVFRRSFSEAFEDGTLPFQQILSLKHGFQALKRIPNGILGVSRHTFGLAKHLYERLSELTHESGQPLAVVYASNTFQDVQLQGGIVNFNLLQRDGSHFGFNVFQRLAKVENIRVRVGCFCNMGACQQYLNLSDEDILRNHHQGHVCGDELDLINGHPTGSIRVSFGAYSSTGDVDQLVALLEAHFVQSEVIKPQVRLKSRPASIKEIYVYPVKSCASIQVQNWKLTPLGLEYDRFWSVMQDTNCLSQKKVRKLCLIQPALDLEHDILTLSYPGATSVSLPIVKKASEATQRFNLCAGNVCGETMEGIDCGNQVSHWLSHVLDMPNLRLVQQLSRSSTHFTTLSLANEAPYLMVNLASVEALSHKVLEETGNSSPTLAPNQLQHQFRANFIVDGAEAFEEDQWTSIVGHGFRLEFHKKCTRCAMIAIDQRTGKDISGIVKSLSRMTQRGFCFGVLFKNSLELVESKEYLTIVQGSRVKINVQGDL